MYPQTQLSIHARACMCVNGYRVYGVRYNDRVSLQISLSKGGNVVVFDVRNDDDHTPYHFARRGWEDNQDNSCVDHLRTFAKHLREKTGFVMTGAALCSCARFRWCRRRRVQSDCTGLTPTNAHASFSFDYHLQLAVCLVSHVCSAEHISGSLESIQKNHLSSRTWVGKRRSPL